MSNCGMYQVIVGHAYHLCCYCVHEEDSIDNDIHCRGTCGKDNCGYKGKT
jgi:hypothetical protein